MELESVYGIVLMAVYNRLKHVLELDKDDFIFFNNINGLDHS